MKRAIPAATAASWSMKPCGERPSQASTASCSVRRRTSTPIGSAEHRLLEELDGAPGVVGEGEHLVELDARTHPVALDDAVEPRSAVERLRVLERLPLVDTAGPAALAPDEVLAEQA